MISNDPAACTVVIPPMARDKDTLKRAVDGLTLGLVYPSFRLIENGLYGTSAS